jgi:hypothetical protein
MKRANRNSIIDGHKVCASCNERKPVGAYHPRPGGVHPYCKACRAAMRAARCAALAGKPDLTIDDRLRGRFNTDQGTGCREWLGAKRGDGYGLIEYQGRTASVHLVVMERAGIVIPEGMVADHLCHNRACANIAHLRVVTERENTLENNTNPWALNAAKTHCEPMGHEYTPENTRWSKSGHRSCRACEKVRANGYRLMKAA